MEGYVPERRNRGRPKKRWIDGVQQDCNTLSMTTAEAGRLARDGQKWRISMEYYTVYNAIIPGSMGYP